MGHRERLLAAARQCLETKGYAGTTARDLVAASGTNLASIGYHFGSKDGLLHLALEEAQQEYTDKVLAVAASVPAGRSGHAPVRESWEAMMAAFADHRPVLVAFLEALVQTERDPELRRSLAASYARLRASVAAELARGAHGADDPDAAVLASFMVAVCDGLMVQWLLAPESVPPAGDLFDVVESYFGAPRS